MDPITLIVGGAVAAAMFLKKKIAQAGGIVIDETKKVIFASVIPAAAQPYADVVLQVASEQGVDPFLIVAIVSAREDPRWDPNIVSPDGGYGLMQITSDKAWIASANWSDPYTNLTKGVQMLKDNLRYFANKGLTGADQLQAALAGYNHGQGNVWRNIQAGQPLEANLPGDGRYVSDVTGALSQYTDVFQNAVAYAAATGQATPPEEA